MIKKWLSAWNWRYPRSLVYMLQASEYSIGDYLRWHGRIKDFTRVERRKKLVKTPKAMLLLAIAWFIVFLIFSAAVYSLWFSASPLNYFLFFFTILIAPLALAYVLTVPLLGVKVLIQWPAEYYIVKKARERLENHPALKIAIAGSFGKTSLREILKTVLSEGKKTAAPSHNYNTPLGISRFVKDLKGDEEILIFELGEYYPEDVRKLCEMIKPELGIITGVNESHLEKFKSLAKTAETIFELADYLGKNPLYINGENKLARESARAGHIIYTRSGVLDWKVKDPVSDFTGTTFVLAKGDKELRIKSKLLGLHQIGPLVAAADIAGRLGISLEKIKKGIENIKPFSHRLEPKVDSSGVITIDDSYNGNPDGVKAAIDFLSGLKNHRRFFVTPGLVEMGSQAEIVHRQIGKMLSQSGIEKVVLIKNSVTGYIDEGLKEYHYQGEVLWFDDALAALAALPYLTAKNDVLLLQNDWPDQYESR